MERKILIVEDEPKVAGFIRSGLSESSLASDWAADGESGIAMLEANNYDLLILDLNLPRKTDSKFARRCGRMIAGFRSSC